MYAVSLLGGIFREDYQMASLRKHRLKYYARVQWRDENKVKRGRTIPLKTHLKSEALVRKSEVEAYEHILKDGEDYKALFPWIKPDGGKTEIVRRTVQESIDEYLSVKDFNPTLERSIVDLR